MAGGLNPQTHIAGTVTCHTEMTKIRASPQKGGVSTNQKRTFSRGVMFGGE